MNLHSRYMVATWRPRWTPGQHGAIPATEARQHRGLGGEDRRDGGSHLLFTQRAVWGISATGPQIDAVQPLPQDGRTLKTAHTNWPDL